jgi:phospholipase D-like protein
VNPAVVTATAVLAAFVAICLADIARAEDVRYLPKLAWAGICLILVPLGGLLYLGIGRTRRP